MIQTVVMVTSLIGMTVVLTYLGYHLIFDDDRKRIPIATYYKVEHLVYSLAVDDVHTWIQCPDRGKPNRFDELEDAHEFLDFHLDRFKSGETIYRIVKVTEEVVY